MANAENELIKAPAEYEAMAPADLKERYSDAQLKEILKSAFDLASAVYFITKSDKIRFITDKEARDEILADAAERQKEHRERNKEARESGQSAAEKVAAETEGQSFRFLHSERTEGGFVDDVNGRRGKIAYVIEEVGDGTRFQVTKGTARALVEIGRLEGFDAKVTGGRKSVAHEAGEKSLADMKETEKADEEPKSEKPEKKAKKEKEEETQGSDSGDDELDDLLDSIPS